MKFRRFKHLTVPILIDDLEFLKANQDNKELGWTREEYKFLKQSRSVDKIDAFHLVFLPNLTKLVSYYKNCSNNTTLSNFKDNLEVSVEVLDIQVSHFLQIMIQNSLNVNITVIQQIVYDYYLLRSQLKKVIDYFYENDDEVIQRTKFFEGEISVIQDWCLYKANSENSQVRSFLFPYSSLLCFYDIISARYNLNLLTCIYNHVKPLNDSLLTIDELNNIFNLGDQCLALYGNYYYNTLKILHPYIVATYLSLKDPYYDKDRIHKLTEGLIVGELFQYVKRMITTKPEPMLKAIGLRNCFGHPIINFKLGIAKIRLQGESYKTRLCANMYNKEGWFKFYIAKNYYKSKNKWPDIFIPTGSPLLELKKNNVPILNPLFTEHQPHWENINFNKLYPLPTDYDVFNILKDSAIAPQRNQWATEIDRHIRYEKKIKIPGTRSTNRSIIRFLQNPELNITDMLERLKTGTFLEVDDLLAVIVPKERELNIKGRGFVKITEKARLWQTIGEYIMSKGLLDDIDGQTMTLDELTSTRLILSATNCLNSLEDNYKDLKCIAISNDFVSWNLKFQFGTTYLPFKLLDDIHGTPGLFCDTHLITTKMMNMGRARFEIPTIDINGFPNPSSTIWYGQSSFFEGMRQKPWTFITLALLDNFMYLNNYKYNIIAQGDNEVIILKIPKSLRQRLKRSTQQQKTDVISAVQRYVKKCMEDLESYFNDYNHELKAEESWYSSILTEYGRTLYKKGIEVPNPYKATYRVHTELNDDYPTLEGHISSIHANLMMSVKHLLDPKISFLLANMEVLFELQQRGTLDDLTKQQKVLLLTIDKTLGGLPISLFYHYNIRGVEDHLTVTLSLLKFIYTCYPEYRVYLCNFLKLKQKSPDYYQLLLDPYSLNFKFPDQPSTFIRDTIRKNLPSIVSSPALASAIDIYNNIESGTFISSLFNLQPLDVKVIKEFFFLSNKGISELLTMSFTNTRSLGQLLEHDFEENRIRTVLHSNDKIYFQNLISQHLNIRRDITIFDRFSHIFSIDTSCSAIIANYLRTSSWGLQMINITKPCPIEQVTLLRDTYNLSSSRLNNSLIIKKINKIVIDKKMNKDYYYGSVTGLRMLSKDYQIVTAPDLILKVKRILRYCNWFDDPYIQEFLVKIIKEKVSNYDEQILSLAPEVLSRDVNHRIRDIFEDGGCYFNNKIEFTTFFSFSTSNLKKYAKKKENYTIHFPHLFLYCINVLLLNELTILHDPLNICEFVLFEFICQTCTAPTYSGKFQMSKPIYYEPIPIYQHTSVFEFTTFLQQHEVDDLPITMKFTYYAVRQLTSWINYCVQFRLNSPNYSFYHRLVPCHLLRITDLVDINVGVLIPNLIVRLVLLHKFFTQGQNRRPISRKLINFVFFPIYNTLVEASLVSKVQKYLLSVGFNLTSGRRKILTWFKFVQFITSILDTFVEFKSLSAINKFADFIILHDDEDYLKRILNHLKNGGNYNDNIPNNLEFNIETITINYHEMMMHRQAVNEWILIHEDHTLQNALDVTDQINFMNRHIHDLNYLRQIIIKFTSLSLFTDYDKNNTKYPYYYKAFKVVEFNTTAFLKYVPVIPKLFNNNNRLEQTLQILGDGDGGLSVALMLLLDVKKAYHYSKVDVNDILNNYTPVYYSKWDLELTDDNIDDLLTMQCDLLATDFIPRFNYRQSNIIVDIDFPFQMNQQQRSVLTNNLLHLSQIVVSHGRLLIVKVNKFFNMDLTRIRQLFNGARYNEVVNLFTNFKIDEKLLIIGDFELEVLNTSIEQYRESMLPLFISSFNSKFLHPWCKICNTYEFKKCPFLQPKRFTSYFLKSAKTTITHRVLLGRLITFYLLKNQGITFGYNPIQDTFEYTFRDSTIHDQKHSLPFLLCRDFIVCLKRKIILFLVNNVQF